MADSYKTNIGFGHIIKAMQEHGFGHEEIMAMRNAILTGELDAIHFCKDVLTGEEDAAELPDALVYDTWELRQVDAYQDYADDETGGGCWIDNTTYQMEPIVHIERGQERTWLFNKYVLGGQCEYFTVEYDGDCYELQSKETGEPLFRLIPTEA